MELTPRLHAIASFFKKYKFIILIILIGILLINIPSKSKQNNTLLAKNDSNPTTTYNLETRLSEALKMIDGAGEVYVIMSVAQGEEVIYQNNETQNSSENTDNMRTDTVMITASDRSTTGLIKQIIPETYMGAIVICSGADDPIVRLSIVEAVSKLTGLGANQISVLKMKSTRFATN